MSAPRLEIDLDKIHDNATTLVERLACRGISVTGVVKATLGSPEIASVLLAAGVRRLADSRIENIEALRRAGITAPITLIRSPMLSQIERVVRSANTSFNTELKVIEELSAAACKANQDHGVVLMVELGDLREGLMPVDLPHYVRETLRFPNIVLEGIGANLACRSGVIPDQINMTELSALADSIDSLRNGTRSSTIDLVSGGNSANLQWALSGADPGRVNDLRLGEAILLGCNPLDRRSIDGLHTDAMVLVAEVIESMEKPSRPWGKLAQNATGERLCRSDRGPVQQALLAIGQQDINPDGLHAPSGITVIGASSDHLITESSHRRLDVGEEVRFGLDYGALLRAMTSPFVSKVMTGECANAVQRRMPTDSLPRHDRSVYGSRDLATAHSS